MGKPKRNLLATAEVALTPPAVLEDGNVIVRVVKGEGSNLWSVIFPGTDGQSLVELPARFRSTIWLKRGGFVIVDTSAFEARSNKLYERPQEFAKTSSYLDDSDEGSQIGKMPPAEVLDPLRSET